MAQGGQPANLSFEREFGKMIGNLDILSALLAEKGTGSSPGWCKTSPRRCSFRWGL
jgi:hypothetical protein